MFKLSQTLGRTWVITLPNPEERYCETQLAEFDFEAVSGDAEAALTKGAVQTFVAFIQAFPERGWEVTSHDTEARNAMRREVNLALGLLP